MLKGLERRFFLIMLCFFMGAWFGPEICVGAETAPQMTASLVPNQTNVGGIVTLTLKFHLPAGAHLAPEPSFKGLAGFRILDQRMIPDNAQKITDGKKKPGHGRFGGIPPSFDGQPTRFRSGGPHISSLCER